MSETTTDVIGAVVKSIDCLDASRRVGWAKAFDALRRIDGAERDTAMARSDLELFRNFAARAFGALTEIVGTGPVNDLFDGCDCETLRSSFPDGPYKTGQAAARKLSQRYDIQLANKRTAIDEMEQDAKNRSKEIKAEIGRLRDELNTLRDNISREAKNQAVDEIVAEFGLVDRRSFWDHLKSTLTKGHEPQ